PIQSPSIETSEFQSSIPMDIDDKSSSINDDSNTHQTSSSIKIDDSLNSSSSNSSFSSLPNPLNSSASPNSSSSSVSIYPTSPIPLLLLGGGGYSTQD